ncbi:MAG: Fic family protein [archaeon]|nr:Fic family protein [archaeon]
MFIEAMRRGKKKKYYLAHSFREGSKIRKIRFYLGENLTDKEQSDRRKFGEKIIKERIRARKVINDPFHTVLSGAELKELRRLEAEGDINVFHLSEEDWIKFTQLFTYNTNAIEGSIIDASEVADILEKNKLPTDKPEYEIFETYGVSEAVEYIRDTEEHLSLKLIKKLHKIVFGNSKSFAGCFRPKGVEVAVVDAAGEIIHRGAPCETITGLLEELVRWYNKNKENYPPIVLAAVVHNQFENIHPFQDGNGRVGRLLLNNILLKHDLPPVNIELKNRKEYYLSLHEYENNRNLRPTIELMINEYKALRKALKKD